MKSLELNTFKTLTPLLCCDRNRRTKHKLEDKNKKKLFILKLGTNSNEQ